MNLFPTEIPTSEPESSPETTTPDTTITPETTTTPTTPKKPDAIEIIPLSPSEQIPSTQPQNPLPNQRLQPNRIK